MVKSGKLALRALALAMAVMMLPGQACADGKSVAQSMADLLGKQCWSCDIYKSLAQSLNTILTQMFSFFVGGTSGFLGFASTILAVVLAWRVIKMFGMGLMPGDGELLQQWDSIFRYAARAAVVFLVFLVTSAANVSSSGGVNPFRDFLVDGPLAAGTEIGCTFISKAASLANDSAIANVQCDGGSSTTSDFMGRHIAGATQILGAFHNLGVGGLSLGVETMMYGATMDNGDFGSKILIGIVGFVLAIMFLMFTLTFGLRYIDALLKALVSLSLAPIFLVLWVFDATRHIAHAAIRSVLFMGALFATSGVVFVMAAAVMSYGYRTALNASGISATEIAGKAVIHVDPGGAANINWYALAMLVGCWGIAIGLAGAAFRTAEELVSFGGAQHQGEMGVGQEAAGKVSGAVQGGIDTGVGILTGGR